MQKIVFLSLLIVAQSFVSQSWIKPNALHKVSISKPSSRVWSPVLKAVPSNEFEGFYGESPDEKDDDEEPFKVILEDDKESDNADDDLFGDSDVEDTESLENDKIKFKPKIPDFSNEDLSQILSNNEVTDDEEDDGTVTTFIEDEDDTGIMGENDRFHEIDVFDGEPVKEVPLYALIYRFRPEYYDKDLTDVVERFDAYCLDYDRVMNADQIQMEESRGMVIMFAGRDATDDAGTVADVEKFIKKDPLVREDVVEQWELLDMNSDEKLEETIKRPPTILPRQEKSDDPTAIFEEDDNDD